MNLGEKIKELRKSKGITQEQLADMLVVSSQAVSKWETGVANPDLALIPDLAKMFEVSTDELLGVDNKDKSENNENVMIDARLARLEKMMGLLTARDDNEALGIILEDAKKVYSFDFTQMPDFEKSDWKLGSSELVEGKNKLIFKPAPSERVVGKRIDPRVINDKIKMSITDVPTIYLSMRSDLRIDLVKIYFTTVENPEWSESNCVRLRYSPGTPTVYVDMSIVHNWYGTLTGLRIDPIDRNLCGIVELLNINLVDKNGSVVYEYDFTDTERKEKSDWTVEDAEILESNNSLKLNVYPVDVKKLVFDPMVQNDNIKINVNRAKHVHIRLKTILENNPHHRVWYNNNIYYDAYLQVYFKTEHNNVYTQDKCECASYRSGCMMDVYVDMSKDPLWNGNLTGLRIDPVEDLNGTFEIERVEILEADKNVGIGGKLSNIENRLANIEGMMDNLEGMYSELEGRLDDLE
ncbi:MAG: helix-turn-helix domain-containing protein [Clostridia bacterium]|nr:helix-turn-helix domain-containing protein [Clostridia bacterium]